MMLRKRLPGTFHQVLPNDNFLCQTPLKNDELDLFGIEKCHLALKNAIWQIWLRIKID